MLVSLKEVSKYVDISNLTAEEIADRLTFAGIEVESIEHYSTGTKLVIGQIIDIKDHPDSDHLHICQVDLGKKYGIKQIVCGAPNARLNLKVICAMVGAKLANNIDIKEGVIRGVASSGMLCSLVELGVNPNYLREEQIKGIEELPEDAEVGNENVLDYLGINDTILNLKLLANRPDCNALLNVAKELSCLFNREYKALNYTKVESSYNSDIIVGSETDKCSKFIARCVKNITVADSPKWLKDTLNFMGVRSINNVVDIGNYVMLVTGQPLHMYDYDKLEKNELIVKENLTTKFVALDENEYDVIDGDLCVTSNNNIECLAGVMGSLHSETKVDTKNIVIEAALFDSKSVRQTSNRLGLVSESSQRFNKGLSAFTQEEAIEFASYLLQEIAGAESFSNLVSYSTLKEEKLSIDCTFSYINNRLSTNYSNDDIIATLKADFIDVVNVDGDSFTAIIPEHRIDMTTKADLSEEVIRIKGFDDIKVELPRTEISVGKLSDAKYKKTLISNAFIDQGCYEVLTYTLVDKKHIENFTTLNSNEPIKLVNELTEERMYTRNNLLLSLVDVAAYNLNRKNDNFKIFEISDIYSKNYTKSHLSIVLSGYDKYQGLLRKEKYDFYYLKGMVESIMRMFGIEKNGYSFQRVEETNTVFHFGKSAYLVIEGKKVGILGELHPSMVKKVDLPKNSSLQCCEIILDSILNLRTGQIKAKEISKYQSVSRDISMIIDKSLPLDKVINEIKKSDKQISNVEIFDIYTGENIGENKVSIAINVTFSSLVANFKDDEIVAMIAKIKDNLAKKLNVELR